MVDKKRLRLFIKLIILIMCFMIILRIFELTLSKYESEVNAETNIDVAFYLFKEDYQTMSINLDKLFPRSTPYTYMFTIANKYGDQVAETNLEYELMISTTTNLPLTFEIYKDETYDQAGAQNIIQTNVIEPDEYGTYFRNINLPNETMFFEEPITITYQLVIYFPENYNTENYQDIIESIEIAVNSKQIME